VTPAGGSSAGRPAGGGPLPPGVHLTPGRGGLPRVEVATPLARAEVYLQGAHVTAYAPRDGPPVLFLSRASRFAPGVPIRGGIPLVFPWFARKAGDPAAPLHGPARLAAWSLEAATVDTAGDVNLVFGLADVAAAGWPAGGVLRYHVGLGSALRLALEVENRGPGPFVFEEALHTYLAVDDVERISVTGLEGAAFLDETEGFARKRDRAAPLVVRGETDRIYDETRATCVVRDPVARRRLEIVKTGSAATVVWNPGAARALPDLGGDEWLRFLCVESGNVGRGAVTVSPGACHRLTVNIRSEPWHGA
jgi:D-hexose-6-phosphate mutarotase